MKKSLMSPLSLATRWLKRRLSQLRRSRPLTRPLKAASVSPWTTFFESMIPRAQSSPSMTNAKAWMPPFLSLMCRASQTRCQSKSLSRHRPTTNQSIKAKRLIPQKRSGTTCSSTWCTAAGLRLRLQLVSRIRNQPSFTTSMRRTKRRSRSSGKDKRTARAEVKSTNQILRRCFQARLRWIGSKRLTHLLKERKWSHPPIKKRRRSPARSLRFLSKRKPQLH